MKQRWYLMINDVFSVRPEGDPTNILPEAATIHSTRNMKPCEDGLEKQNDVTTEQDNFNNRLYRIGKGEDPYCDPAHRICNCLSYDQTTSKVKEDEEISYDPEGARQSSQIFKIGTTTHMVFQPRKIFRKNISN